MAARVAVVGHVEWVTRARGEVPPAGGIARLAGRRDLHTALAPPGGLTHGGSDG